MKSVIKPQARQDILNQFIYLAGQGVPNVADRFIDAVDETIAQLSRKPRLGSSKKLKNPRLQGLRKWPVKGFDFIWIYYLLTVDTLRVIRVLHGKRDVERILNNE
jgi:toxin ParE1/3/4